MLGVFTDRSKEKNEEDNSSIDSKKGDKKAKKKISMFIHGRHTSRSMTDVSSTVPSVASPVRHSIDLLGAHGDQTTPRQRTFLVRRRSPIRKSRSYESQIREDRTTETMPARLAGIRRTDVSESLRKPQAELTIADWHAETVISFDRTVY